MRPGKTESYLVTHTRSGHMCCMSHYMTHIFTSVCLHMFAYKYTSKHIHSQLLLTLFSLILRVLSTKNTKKNSATFGTCVVSKKGKNHIGFCCSKSYYHILIHNY